MVEASKSTDNRIYVNLDDFENELARQLKDICDGNGKEKNYKESAKILHQLGKVYQKRNSDLFCFIKSAALYNAAIARSPDNVKDIQNDLKELCKQILEESKAENQQADLMQKSNQVKEAVEDMRSEVERKLLPILPIPDDDFGPGTLHCLETEKIRAMKKLQSEITDNYTKIMANVAKYCEKVMGRAPCTFALAGMGSLARKEITPYSDFENIILLKDTVKTRKDYENILSYFRWFSVIFHVILINLQETIIPSVAIGSLNEKSSKLGNWFYDGFTTRGISFDGMMPHACKFPLGRQQLTENKQFQVELIKPVSEMLKYLSSEENLKNGYHLSDILTKTCFVYKSKKVFAGFENAVYEMLEKNSKQDILNEVKQQVVNDLGKFATRSTFSFMKRNQKINIKHVVYRSTTLFIAALGRVYNIRASSCFEILSGLAAKGAISEKMKHKLLYAVALACEIRLRWYMQNKTQCDEMDSIQTLLKIVGNTSTVNYFQIAYSLQCDISKRWLLKKLHFYSHPALLNLGLACCFGSTLKLDELKQLIGRFHDFEDCLSLLEKKKIKRMQLNTSKIEIKATIKTALIAKIIQSFGIHLSVHQHCDDALFCFAKSTELLLEQDRNEGNEIVEEIGLNHYMIGACYRSMNKFSAAIDHLEKSMRFKQTLVSLATKLYIIGDCYLLMEKFEKALQRLQQSRKLTEILSIDVERDIQLAKILRDIGGCLKYTSPNEAKEHFEKALNISQQVSNDREIAHTLLDFALLLNHTGEFEQAKLMEEESLKLLRKISSNPMQDVNVMQLRCSIGKQLLREKQPIKAKKYFEAALQLYEKISIDEDSDRLVADVVYDIGKCLFQLNKYEESFQHFERAQKIYEQLTDDINSDSSVYQTEVWKGECLFSMKMFERARKCYIKSFQVYEQTSPMQYTKKDQTYGNILFKISVCSVRTGKLDECITYLHKSRQAVLRVPSGKATYNDVTIPIINQEMIRNLIAKAGACQDDFKSYQLKTSVKDNGETSYTLIKVDDETESAKQIIQHRDLN